MLCSMKNTAALTPGLLEWSLADRLRKVRRDVAKLGQEEFADALGVSIKAYGAWEAGRNTPRELVALAKRIEVLTGVPAAWMLGIEETPRTPAMSTERPVITAVNGCYPGDNSHVVIPFPQAESVRRGYRRNWRRTEKVRRTRTRMPQAPRSGGHSYAALEA